MNFFKPELALKSLGLNYTRGEAFFHLVAYNITLMFCSFIQVILKIKQFMCIGQNQFSQLGKLHFTVT